VDSPYQLFEVSWEVCNKVGGIHTVLSSKARTMQARLGDRYAVIGPWLLSDESDRAPLDEIDGYADFCDSCRELGVPVRIGRWRIPSRPLAILVEFSGLYARKDDLLAELWEEYKVDSLSGEWDYVEPVVFGRAAGMVIRRWWEEFSAPRHGKAVAHFHEWMTGSGMLYLKQEVPEIGTVFTTHATVLGRSVASTGVPPMDGLGEGGSKVAAEHHNVGAKHSLEGVCARHADVFTTVSAVTAEEAELYHGRRAEPLLPNGIDLDVIDELIGDHARESVRRRLCEIAACTVGEDVGEAALIAISGRYEFHNKGIDVLLDALHALNGEEGRRIVLFALIPAGNSGILPELAERLERGGPGPDDGPLGVATHALRAPESDPILARCGELGFDNARGERVRVVHVPLYLEPGDGLLDAPYEAVLQAFDLTAFPSFYEPWGYTPQESLAVGVPTVTTDCAGFGVWAVASSAGSPDGVTVVHRVGVAEDAVLESLTAALRELVAADGDREALAAACRATAAKTSWSDLGEHYLAAYGAALRTADERCAKAYVPHYRPKVSVPVRSSESLDRPRLFEFDVAATLPPELAELRRLAENYYWVWDPEAQALFRELSPQAWTACGRNPIRYLRSVFAEDVAAKAKDASFTRRLRSAVERFDNYMAETSDEVALADGARLNRRHPAVYLCAEYGIHDSLPIYSGGLGILAGDHLKSASDLNLPLVAVGLFYRRGYLRQRLSIHGEQIDDDYDNDPRNQPLELVTGDDGHPVEVTLQLPSSSLVLRAWRARVGRVDLYLLDADHDKNRPEDRVVTERLYSAEPEQRLRQLITLGRGGLRFLHQLGVDPRVVHVNEGHGAFACLERVARLMRERGLTFEEGREAVRSSTVFTTHTPVPAGHDRFSEDLIRRYFSDVPQWSKLGWDEFVDLGRAAPGEGDFNMTYLALAFADVVNGVSHLHGLVSKELLQPVWPRLLTNEVPVDSITNGIHLPTWTNPELAALLGAEGRSVTGDDFRRAAGGLDPAKLWEVRTRAKERLVEAVGRHLQQSFVERQDSPAVLSRMLEGLTGDALLVGFARRFVPYKRADLAFRDLERMRAILDDEERPVRLLFAGKAHPADEHGQEIVKRVAELGRRDEYIGRVFFLENYDMEIARLLVQGVDVWLNNPIRKLEASGTSGMKAACNGGLNLSVLDGWWVEGYDGRNGWAIGNERMFPEQELQNEMDAENLYRLLEEEVVPLYFERNRKGLPLRWLERARHCLATVPPVFNTDRMVSDYRDRAYAPLAVNAVADAREDFGPARHRAEHFRRVRRAFADVKISAVSVTHFGDLNVGDDLEAHVEVDLAGLSPDDVIVELVVGHKREADKLHHPVYVPLAAVGEPAVPQPFEGSHRMERSGNYAYGIRVRPRTDGGSLALSDLMCWA